MFLPQAAVLQLTRLEIAEKNGIKLYIKREDLIHEAISGNKWRKLFYNLQEAKELGYKKILTFGGAYSNHIAATAYAGKYFGMQTIGVIRGEQPAHVGNTLQTAAVNGMQLHFVSREAYKNKEDAAFVASLHQQYGQFYLIPEGGANVLGVIGCEEITTDITLPYDYICCPCGTGTTLAGIVNGLQGKAQALGFSVLKTDGYFENEVKHWLKGPFSNWQIIYNYHFGGYAKVNEELKAFVYHFYRDTAIPLDGIYTGKMMYGIMKMIEKGYFEKGSTIVAIHTGGLQGNEGLGIHF